MQAVVMIMPQGSTRRTSSRSTAPTRVRDGRRRGRARWSSTWCGERSSATICPPSRGSRPRSPTRCRSWKGCRIPCGAAEYGHMLADLAGVSRVVGDAVALDHVWAASPQEVAKTMKRVTAQEKVEREMSEAPGRATATRTGRSSRRIDESTSDAVASTAVRRAARRRRGRRARSPAARTRSSRPRCRRSLVEPLDGDGSPTYAAACGRGCRSSC